MVQLMNSAVLGAAGWSNLRDWDVIDLAMSEAQAHSYLFLVARCLLWNMYG